MCISYDEVRRFLTSAATYELDKINNGVYVPSNLVQVSEGVHIVHEGDDNIDINCQTIDGKHTFHAMARVLFQEQPDVEQIINRIQRLPQKSLHLSPEAEQLMQVKHFPK